MTIIDCFFYHSFQSIKFLIVYKRDLIYLKNSVFTHFYYFAFVFLNELKCEVKWILYFERLFPFFNLLFFLIGVSWNFMYIHVHRTIYRKFSVWWSNSTLVSIPTSNIVTRYIFSIFWMNVCNHMSIYIIYIMISTMKFWGGPSARKHFMLEFIENIAKWVKKK